MLKQFTHIIDIQLFSVNCDTILLMLLFFKLSSSIQLMDCLIAILQIWMYKTFPIWVNLIWGSNSVDFFTTKLLIILSSNYCSKIYVCFIRYSESDSEVWGISGFEQHQGRWRCLFRMHYWCQPSCFTSVLET